MFIVLVLLSVVVDVDVLVVTDADARGRFFPRNCCWPWWRDAIMFMFLFIFMVLLLVGLSTTGRQTSTHIPDNMIVCNVWINVGVSLFGGVSLCYFKQASGNMIFFYVLWESRLDLRAAATKHRTNNPIKECDIKSAFYLLGGILCLSSGRSRGVKELIHHDSLSER